MDGEHLKAPGISTSIFQHKGAMKEDAWCETTTKVFKACIAVKEAPDPGHHDFNIIVPLVILDGDLLAAQLEQSGSISLSPVEHAEVLFSYASSRYVLVDDAVVACPTPF